jgi:two-component system cell cycle response regulator DivK
MPGDREQTLAAGCTDYIAKPISPRALLDLVEHYLKGAGHGNDSDR